MIFNLDKLFPQIFGNPIIIYALLGIMIIVAYIYLRKGEGKTNMKVFYFAEVERLLSPLVVKSLTPKSVLTKDDKRFMRRAKSWLWKDKGKSFVVFLGKVGRGLTYRLEQNPTDKEGKPVVEKIGSLYEGLKACLEVKEDNELTPQTFTSESLELLKKSEIFVCIDLETDTKDMPDITEESSVTEADRSMMDLVGTKIRQQLRKEDWIRNIGLMALGALAYVLSMQLGLL